MKDRHQKWVHELEANPNLVHARGIVEFVLKDTLYEPSEDAENAKTIQRVIEIYPTIDLNFLFAPSYERMTYDEHNRREGALRKFPTVNGSMTSPKKEKGVYYYVHCTPLMVAGIYNLPAIMRVLLSHPTIDLTVHTQTEYWKTAYSLTPWNAFNCKKQLKEAHIKQFYRQALTLPLNQMDILMQMHQDAGLTPKDLRLYMIEEIMRRVNEKTDPNDQNKILIEEKSKKIAPNNILITFLGKEWDAVEAAISTKYKAPAATQAPTVNFVEKKEPPIDGGSNDLGASTSNTPF